eukprot:TRINITY_DN13288_c0_g2_i1.p1 TRINITY_DN13288_c0_g2~~TRINITY_DN13288_c0_g2_i1.p1  ORF type:complete len:166 (+),score=31.10 TRINITY_DN13288_c0_g2_i1:137-634(+)
MEEAKCEKRLAEVKVYYGSLTRRNWEILQIINKLCLPVIYSEPFYVSLVLDKNKYCRVAYLKDIPIGGISCKVEDYKGEKSMYIMTIGVLPKYRRYKVATRMLDLSIAECAKQGEAVSIHLHVQTSNESAIRFYQKSGFQIMETLKNYYKENIVPPDAHLMYKKL